MVKRTRPILALAVALLLGCADNTPPMTESAPVAATPPAAVAAVAAPVATIDSADPMAAASSEPSRLAQALPTQASLAKSSILDGKWQAGRNYTLLSPAQPTNVGPGKVEVIEVFWYGCSHCYELDPYLESWKKNKPAYVEFVRLPVVWGPGHKLHGRLFYTLQVLGKLDTLHAKVFDTVHRGGNMLIAQDEDASFKMQLAWAEANGVNGADFKREYNGFAVNTALQRAEQLTKRYRVAGVPLMIVNGRYSTDLGAAGGHSQLLSLLNDLAASEKR